VHEYKARRRLSDLEWHNHLERRALFRTFLEKNLRVLLPAKQILLSMLTQIQAISMIIPALLMTIFCFLISDKKNPTLHNPHSVFSPEPDPDGLSSPAPECEREGQEGEARSRPPQEGCGHSPQQRYVAPPFIFFWIHPWLIPCEYLILYTL